MNQHRREKPSQEGETQPGGCGRPTAEGNIGQQLVIVRGTTGISRHGQGARQHHHPYAPLSFYAETCTLNSITAALTPEHPSNYSRCVIAARQPFPNTIATKAAKPTWLITAHVHTHAHTCTAVQGPFFRMLQQLLPPVHKPAQRAAAVPQES